MRKLKYLSAALLTAIALTACEDDLAVINPDPGQPSTAPDETADVKGYFSSDFCPKSELVIFPLGDLHDEERDPADNMRSDYFKFVLHKPAEHDITLRVDMEPDYANYVIDNGIVKNDLASYVKEKYNLFLPSMVFPDDNGKNIGLLPLYSLNGEKSIDVTIKAGETESESINLSIQTDKFGQWPSSAYLFPFRAVEVSTGETYGEIYYYAVSRADDAAVGNKGFVAIGYIDTEVMNPLIVNELPFEITTTRRKPRPTEKTTIYKGKLYDIINLRTATIKESDGKAQLAYTSDMEYVLKHSSKYIAPLQKNDIKVCLTIKGGGNGLGFSNMTSDQIADFVTQLKVAVDMYGLDGINLWDEGAGYDNLGAAPVKAESYAKLIKAIKNAMPDKLLTLVDTRSTTEVLCNEVEGIKVGDYIDYAWSDLEKFVDPYSENSSIKPLSGLMAEKYGSVFMRDFTRIPETELELIDEAMSNMESEVYLAVAMDIPYYDYIREADHWQMPWTLIASLKYPNIRNSTTDIRTSSSVSQTKITADYYAFKKDW